MFKTLSNLTDHCSYEFCYAYHFDIVGDNLEDVTHWNSDAIYIVDELFDKIASYIDRCVERFHYYGPPFKMSNDLWNKIKTLAIQESEDRAFVLEFFDDVDLWKQKDPNDSDFFWIIGI